MSNVLQYSVWSNCCNSCEFCLRKERIPYTKEMQLRRLERIKANLDYIDWKGRFANGISLLGGELYYTHDKELQESFLELIDLIIEKVLKVSPNPYIRYSTVTNGLYEPTFLYQVIDKIVNAVGVKNIDINFSYDLKYRYKSKEDEEKVIKNINDFHERYNYKVGIQMILTQYVIESCLGGFDIINWVNKIMPGNQLCFLYPHPIHTGIKLDDFFFKRADFLKFLIWFKQAHTDEYLSFMLSTKNSATYKWTGLKDVKGDDNTEQPKLTDGKEEITECGHSVLYRCYADSDKCLFCDLLAFDEDVYYG